MNHLRALCLALPATAAVLAAGAGEAAAHTRIPWGAGCEPAPSATTRTAADCGAQLIDGRAVAPPRAPSIVQRVIAAANEIDGRPYVWGGGHRSFYGKGYDCSGAVSYALHGAGLLDVAMVSGQLAHWGDPGPGRWITVYANSQHVFMIVAGLRFDTRDDLGGVSGPRWKLAGPEPLGLAVFSARHPAGF